MALLYDCLTRDESSGSLVSSRLTRDAAEYDDPYANGGTYTYQTTKYAEYYPNDGSCWHCVCGKENHDATKHLLTEAYVNYHLHIVPLL